MLLSVPRRIRKNNVLIPYSSGQRCIGILASTFSGKRWGGSKGAPTYGRTIANKIVDRASIDHRIEIIAHRGFSGMAPENTISAIEAAIEVGADAVEFDIQFTSDGSAVLFHDDTLERTTNGSGLIREQTLEELAMLDAGSWFSPQFSGEPIPTLALALARIDLRVTGVYAEVKGSAKHDEIRRIIQTVMETGDEARMVFIAIDWSVLDRLRALRSELNIGYIVQRASRAEEAIARASQDSRALINFDAKILLDNPEVANYAIREGIDMVAWTVDDSIDAARLLEVGVRRITTNQVATLLRWKATL